MDQILLRFDPSSVLAGAVLPITVATVLVLLFIPSLLAPGARPAGVGHAIYCYAMQGAGIFLMTAGGLPALSSVIHSVAGNSDGYSTETYLALLLLFAVGGLLFLWHEQMAAKIESASAAVPAVIFWFTFKIAGLFLVISSALSLLLTMLLVAEPPSDWWSEPLLMLLYGLLLLWCTRMPAYNGKSFQSSAIMSKAAGIKKAKK